MTYDLNDFKKAKIDPNEPHMRVLKCAKCKTIEEVPDYEGPEGGEGSAEYDHILKFFTDDHVRGKCKRDDFTTVRFPTRFWMIPKVKEAIEAQLKDGSQGLDVFGTDFYATKNNHSADAMTCWLQHRQTKDCGEYKSEKKVLSAGTERERKLEGLSAYTGKKVYLCDYCPVKSIVQGKHYKKQGLL